MSPEEINLRLEINRLASKKRFGPKDARMVFAMRRGLAAMECVETIEAIIKGNTEAHRDEYMDLIEDAIKRWNL